MFAVQNAGPQPVNVRRGDKLFMLALSRLDPSEQRDPDATRLDHIPSKWITSVRGPPVTLVEVHERAKTLERRWYFARAIFWTVFTAPVATLIGAATRLIRLG